MIRAVPAFSTVKAPQPASPLGFMSWAREMRALAACHLRPPCPPGGDLPSGGGRHVLVLPGFLTGDWTTVRLRTALSAHGFHVTVPGIAVNLGPTRRVLARLEGALDAAVAQAQGPVALVGQSLGGTFARALAHLYPHKVSAVVTLCSPIHFPVETSLAPFVWALEPFHDASFRGLAPQIAQAPSAPVTAIYSTIDGIVAWQACVQAEGPERRNIRIDGAHTTMGSNPLAQAEVIRALAP